MDSLFKYGRYGSINTTDTPTDKFYVTMFISEAQALKNKTIDRKNTTAGKLVVKAQYICSMQKTN